MAFCRNCGQQIDPQAAVCIHCGVAAGVGQTFCPNCGQPTIPGAAVCTQCGVALAQPIPQGEQKSKVAAGLLGIFLGAFGVHNFYLGYTNKAVVQLLVSLLGGTLTCGIATFAIEIWSLVEGIQILTGSINKDARGIPLKD